MRVRNLLVSEETKFLTSPQRGKEMKLGGVFFFLMKRRKNLGTDESNDEEKSVFGSGLASDKSH